MKQLDLDTVCEEAHCPNIGECWAAGTLTFMILGDICTRNCGFCAVTFGGPPTFDPREPERVAKAVGALGLAHVVVTSVARDDLPDGGAAIFAQTIRKIREHDTKVGIEVLIPDFRGSRQGCQRRRDSGPWWLTKTGPRAAEFGACRGAQSGPSSRLAAGAIGSAVRGQ